MAKHVVVLGGGTAGTMVANRLARRLSGEIARGDVQIRLISNTEQHIYQPGYLFVVFNEKEPGHFIRKQREVVHRDVELTFDDVERIDASNNRLVSKKAQYEYDYLVIATGSFPNMDSLPGLAQGAHNFYTLEGAERLRDELASFAGGRILITIDVPHKCPAAPLELVLMLDDYLRGKGIREKVELTYTYPINRIHSLQPVAEWALPEFEKRDIRYEVFFNLEEVDPARKVAVTMDGEEHPYDLLISIPAHTGAKVVMDSGLGDEDGFVPTDRYRLKMEGSDSVYVIGDATNLPVSKAGSAAHYQGETLVHNLASRLLGLPETARYNGKVACFLENSLKDASMITFDYDTPPDPARTSDLMHWFKGVYNEIYWLNVRGIL